MAESKTFLFVFPQLAGHINPSFPVAKALMKKGHKIHYICRDTMKGAIEGIGATFHADQDVYKTMLEGRELDMMGFGCSASLQKELGMENPGFMTGVAGTEYRGLELKLADLVPFVKEMSPDSILYCPMICPEAGFVGKVLDIPVVSLNTVAGPGALRIAYLGLLAMDGMTLEQFFQWREEFGPRGEARTRVNEKYGIGIPDGDDTNMLGQLNSFKFDKATFITTIDALMAPMVPELAAAYEKDGVKFEGVGPLLDEEEGAVRAAAMKRAATDELHAANPDKVLAAVQAAKKGGRMVILVSMGTMITGDDPHLGWEAKPTGPDGEKRGLANKDVCRCAWGAVFEAAGKSRDHVGPLIIVSIGSQKDALGDLEVPANAICQQSVPQVDILREGVDVFMMGGGQNGFQEGLINAAPFVVCPVAADQIVTGAQAEAMGVGVSVARPDPNPGEEEPAKAEYRAAMTKAVEEVLADQKFKDTVQVASAQFAGAAGVARVVEALGA